MKKFIKIKEINNNDTKLPLLSIDIFIIIINAG